MAREQHGQPFDLATPPTFRALLVRLTPTGHLLLITVHHVTVDGWSKGVLLDELSAAYAARLENRPPHLVELPFQYADYAVWQRRLAEEGRHDRLREYWLGRLDGILELPGLPLDRPRPQRSARTGRWLRFHIPDGTRRALLQLCRQEECTLFVALLSAAFALLSRHSGQQDVVVGTSMAGRPAGAAERLIGYFVNQVVLRADLTGPLTWRDLLRQARTTALDAYTHQELPFEEVVKALNPPRQDIRNPLFQVKLVLDNTPRGQNVFPGLTVTPYEPDLKEYSPFDISILTEEDEHGINGIWQYDPELFDAERMTRMLDEYVALIEAMVNGVDQPVHAALPELTSRMTGPRP